MPDKDHASVSSKKAVRPQQESPQRNHSLTIEGQEHSDFGSEEQHISPQARRRIRSSAPLMAQRAVSFGLVGGFVALVGFVILYVLVEYAGLNKNLAYLIQAVVSIELNFFLNRSVTWRDRRGTGFTSFLGMWARFHLTRVATVALNQVLFGAFIYIGINYLISNGLCIIIVMVINFFVGDRFIFRSRPAAASLVEVLTADLINPDVNTEPRLTSILGPRALPATGWPTVSVIVPVGRNRHGIEPTVSSLLRQDYPGEIEIILVGDKGDPAWDDIRWYIDDGLVTIVEAEMPGSTVALGKKRLAGIGRARGQILASLDPGLVPPSTWVSSGVDYIRDGWPCVVGPTAGFDRLASSPTLRTDMFLTGRVLDPERLHAANYVPPLAANLFIAGDVLPNLLSTRTNSNEIDNDYLEWIWNLAQADVAVFETPTIAAGLAFRPHAGQIARRYADAGAVLAKSSRQSLRAAGRPRRRTRVIVGFVAVGMAAALAVVGSVAFDWPRRLNALGSGGLPNLSALSNLPSGFVIALLAAVCALALEVASKALDVEQTGQWGAVLAPLYRLIYAWDVTLGRVGGALRAPRRASGTAETKAPRFVIKHAPDEAFTRPMATMPPGPMRRRAVVSSSGPRLTPGITDVAWPSVSVVIPVKENQTTIGTTVRSLLTQDYRGSVEILLVGDIKDPTWEPIQEAINSGRVRILEVEVHSANRDANAKRTIGLKAARGEILALTDSDMVLPSHWISTGIQYILRGWPCVAGPMRGATGNFWDAYADLVSLGSKTPRFVVNRVLDDERYGRPNHKPPITANVFMTREALGRAGDFDASFVHSYEDYSWFWAACKAGVPILCTPSLQADHYHRQGWRRLLRQYTRAGRGCADFIMKNPESPLSRLRVVQWMAVWAAMLGAIGLILAGVVATNDPELLGLPASFAQASTLSLPLDVLDPLALVLLTTLGLLGLGIMNAMTVRQVRAVVFPFITLFFGLAFSYGMAVEFTQKLVGRTIASRGLHLQRTQVVTAVMYAGILVVSAGLRLWNLDARPGYEWDEPVYGSVGAHFAQFGSVTYKAPIARPTVYLSHPPFYFAMLGEWFRIVGSGITQARVLSVLMSLLLITILYGYLRQRMGAWALLPTLLVALDGWIVFANRISWIDNSVVVFGVLGIWAYFHALKRDSGRAYIAAGLALGFTLVFKQLGVYFCAIPALNWVFSRQRTRGHLVMLGTVGVCVMLYLAYMLSVYKSAFMRQTMSQIFRSSGSVTSRGVVSPQDVITALVGQYHIFAFTVLLCVVSLAWLGTDIFRSIRRRDGSWLRRYSIEASWIIAGIVVFIAVQIKFPNYFIYLMIPLLVYLGMRIRDVASGWLSADLRHPRLLRTGLIALLVLVVGCDLGAFYMRIVDQSDNALWQVANYVTANVPADVTVLADEPVGVMIPQPYCKLESAGSCPDVKWVVTYTSLTQKLPTQASDPQLYVLLHEAEMVQVFRGFKETITVYRVVAAVDVPTPTPTPIGTPTVIPTVAPTAVPTAVPTAPRKPVPTATPTPVPTATPTPVPTATPTPAGP
jgi:cellulose synthase/poly-beta-1,6-N-acetylglucosamine synthase-like glycosyltransferase